MESNGVTIQNEGTKVCIFVEEGTEEIQHNTYAGNKDVVLHIPLSVRKIAEASINPRRTNEVEVFYAGTKKDWEDISKGHYESWCEEDYHRIGMGVSRTIFEDWAVHNRAITIHCLDGDIVTKDRSYRD